MIAGAVVLSAGSSVRMGAPKALLEHRGQRFIEIVVDHLRDLASPVIVVLGEHAEQIVAGADLRGAAPVVNPDHALGMSTSVWRGMDALVRTAPQLDGAYLCLVDQPLVRRATYELVGSSAPGPDEVRIAAYEGRPGHPVLLGKELVTRLAAGLGAPSTLEEFLTANARRTLVETSDPAVLQNVNTPEAYRSLYVN